MAYGFDKTVYILFFFLKTVYILKSKYLGIYFELFSGFPVVFFLIDYIFMH